MNAVVLAFKAPSKPAKPHGVEPKIKTGCWLDTDKFDEISRYLLSPEVPYETRVQWLNNWRTEWKLEPLYMRELRSVAARELGLSEVSNQATKGPKP